MSQMTKQERASDAKIVESPSTYLQGELLRKAMDWALNDRMFTNLKTHGNVSWSAKMLVTLAILMAWSEAKKLTDAYTKAALLSDRMFSVVAIATYQGLMRALVTYGPQLLPRLWLRLQTLMERSVSEPFRISGWVPLAVDGSRFTTPRTRSNEKSFAAQRFGIWV